MINALKKTHFKLLLIFGFLFPKLERRIRINKLLTQKFIYADVRAALSYENSVNSGLLDGEGYTNFHVQEPLYSDILDLSDIYKVLDKLNRGKTETMKWSAFEERLSKIIITTSATLTSATTAGALVEITLATAGTLPVVHARYIGETVKLLDIAIDEANGYQGEGIIREIDVANNKIKVAPIDSSKKFGKASGSNPASGLRILMTGNAQDEFADAQIQPTDRPEKKSNVNQRFSTTFGIGWEAGKQRTYAMPEIQRIVRQKKVKHAQALVASMLFNGTQYSLNQTYAQETQFDYAEGIEKQILSGSDKNVSYANQSEVYSKFMVFQDGLADPTVGGGLSPRIGLPNKAFKQFVSQMIIDRGWHFLSDAEGGNTGTYKKVFGVNGVKTVDTGQLTFDLMYDPILCSVYNNFEQPYLQALHLNYVELGDFHETEYRMNIQNRSTHGRIDEWYTVMTNLVLRAELMGVFRITQS